MRRILIICALLGLSAGSAGAQREAVIALLRVQSDPPGAFIRLGQVDSAMVAPADTTLAAGSYRLESSLLGYQPLTHEFSLDPGDTLLLRFVLLSERPVRPIPADLGLSYEPVLPLLMEEQADALRRRFNAMAEIFAIVPLMQGVMAAVALGGGEDYFSAGLMVTGVCLSGGSYIAGKIAAGRKLARIRERNEEISAQNAIAAQYNKEVDRQIREIHSENIRRWQQQAGSRGIVESRRGESP